MAVWSRTSVGSSAEIAQSALSVEAFEALREELELLGSHADRLSGALQVVGNGVVLRDESGVQVFADLDPAISQDPATRLLVDRAIVAALDDARLGEETTRTVEVFGPPKRTLSVIARTLSGPHGNLGTVAVVHDVTERERTESMRRDFVTNVSHELRTPVGALSVLAETLRTEVRAPDGDPAVIRRLADRVESESHRLSELIDDLLALAAASDHVDGEMEVSLSGCLVEAVERVRSAAEVAEVELIVPDGLPSTWVIGDRRQLTSAIYNLLDNAVKYSDHGSSVDVDVRVDRSVQPPLVRLEVADQGLGIPIRDRERIFERFYRVDRARARQTGGSGLGLSIVRNIARAHGGDVSVRSVEGHGSVFSLSLPFSRIDTAVSGQA
jgi:two-component system, OmpR family, sensor histidine kinase SenX3